jgi:hypothetical protein
MFAAMITFSAYEEDGITVAQVQPLMRANDPLYEMSMRLGLAHKLEDGFWHAALRSLASHFGVNGQIQQRTTLVDPRMQWREGKNIWQNAAVRSGIHTVVTPIRWARNRLRP